ncbi:hypothetical protein BG006_006198 [Podila minutissima]|uniref:Glycosyltransferase n=1 Tax=Podila minutissima TaxID=64525 RepID=A0A9P5SLK1_9FUNG|nr:hypothetical protein BG006_006198 [Podila minutissima]
MNYSAILEPFDRKFHTSAHFLDYFAKDHLYLFPPPEVRMPPNRAYSTAAAPLVSSSALTAHPEFNASNIIDEEDDGYKIEDGLSGQATGKTTPLMHFHMFWRAHITDKLLLAVYAFLFTQPMDRSRLHLWIDSTDLPGGRAEDYHKNSFTYNLVLRPMNQFVCIHRWDHKAQEAYAYPPSSHNSANTTKATNATITTTTNITPVAFSDEARFLILHRYGGMYLDADTLLLRDMSPICDTGLEFAYEWSNLKIYNAAIMKLDKGGVVVRQVLDGVKVREQEIQAKKEQQQQQQDHSSVFVKPIEPPERMSDEMCPDGIYHPDRIRYYLRFQDGALENNGLVMIRKAPKTPPVSPFDIPEILERILLFLPRHILKRVVHVLCRQWFLLSRRLIPQRLHSSGKFGTQLQSYDDIHTLL